MSNMRKYINILIESNIPMQHETEFSENTSKNIDKDTILSIFKKYPGALEAWQAGDNIYDVDNGQLWDELYSYFLKSGQISDNDPAEYMEDELAKIIPINGNADGWELEPMYPYDENVEEDSIYQGADEYVDTVEPCCSGGDGSTPDENFGDDEVYEGPEDQAHRDAAEKSEKDWDWYFDQGQDEEYDDDEEVDDLFDQNPYDSRFDKMEASDNNNEWWENQFNETLERMKNLAGICVVAEDDDANEEVTEESVDDETEENDDKKEVDEAKKPDADGDGVPDWADKKPGEDDNEKVDESEELHRFLKMAGISEDSIYPNATHMNTEKNWDEMGNESAGPNEKFGNDEIYSGEEGPLACSSHTNQPGEDKTPSTPFSHKMAEAALAGKGTFEHNGQTFKVRMNEERAQELLEKKKPSADLSDKKKSSINETY